MNQSSSFKRLNITVNADTWDRVKDIVPNRERSKFVDQALRVYLANLKQQMLRNQLKKEALESANEGVRVAKEWFNLDREIWKKIK